ncbi:MAG: methyltransferase domain-containing protein [Myxococcales bacterium FL481]|nr:MAG: methyltransferase domain-containing protein [Myxococcales bacterium FL481]
MSADRHPFGDDRVEADVSTNQSHPEATTDAAFKRGVRQMWALGNYAEFAHEFVWDLGPELVQAANVRRGQRVLDVAAGTGNAAIRAAALGAQVVASDLTPEHFPAGRDNARATGVQLEWVEADAEALPFADDSFDVVMSCVGAIFAPRHQRVADELVRVCRPGGTIAMLNFSSVGLFADFLGVFQPYMPAPRPQDLPPPLWGDEAHLRALFGDRVDNVRLESNAYVERAASPRAYCEFCKRTFGPAVAIYAGLDAERAAKLDAAFEAFATMNNRAAEGPIELHYPYVIFTANPVDRAGLAGRSAEPG